MDTKGSPLLKELQRLFNPEIKHFEILEAAQSLTNFLKKSKNKKGAEEFTSEHLSKLRQDAERFFYEEFKKNNAISTEEKNRWFALHQEYIDAVFVWVEKVFNGTDTSIDIARLQAKRDSLIWQSNNHLHARIDKAEAKLFGTKVETKLLNTAIFQSEKIEQLEALIESKTQENSRQPTTASSSKTGSIKKWTVKLAEAAILSVIKQYAKNNPLILTLRFLEDKTGCPKSTIHKTDNYKNVLNIKEQYRKTQGKMSHKPKNFSAEMQSITTKNADGTFKIIPSHKKKNIEGDDYDNQDYK
jgi:hypothetical protein